MMQNHDTVQLRYFRSLRAVAREAVPTLVVLGIAVGMMCSSQRLRDSLSAPWRDADKTLAVTYVALTLVTLLMFFALVLFVGYLNLRGTIWLLAGAEIEIDVLRRMFTERRSRGTTAEFRITRAQDKRIGILLECENGSRAVRRWLPRCAVTSEQWTALQRLCAA